MPLFPVMNYIILGVLCFHSRYSRLKRRHSNCPLVYTNLVRYSLGLLPMLNTDDEDALSEELIEMAGVKEIYKNLKKKILTIT